MTENHEFNEIYEKYKNSVLRAAYLYVKDPELAEDVRQDTFLKLLRMMSGEGPVENIDSWLYTTAKNTAINYLKRSKWEASYDSEEESEVSSREPVRESTEDECLEELTNRERAELHRRVMEGVWKKSERWYEAIVLEAHVELPQKEAAKVMKMSLNAYQVMLHRARDWIRENYGVEYEELKRK